MAQGYKRVTVNATGCGFDFHSSEMKYLIFSFLPSGAEAKRGVVFRHSTVMPPEFGEKWRAEYLNIRLPLSTLLHTG